MCGFQEDERRLMATLWREHGAIIIASAGGLWNGSENYTRAMPAAINAYVMFIPQIVTLRGKTR